MIIIEWNTKVLAVGRTLLLRDQAFRVESSKNGITLVIPDAGREHEEQYCEIPYQTKTSNIVQTVKMKGGELYINEI